mmetsp:Transcript_36212/g.56730  ORF Transcript_36212/g.56730 Transcript_36212/m.56730 type:complete len:509 (-) Transcript_36212:36-1562(-)|eukprot:CAMPEP_0201517104 /NCGR_PEP_ID=MMETSP0161_2-20130828/8303_1 /ASSEMBLY_ACC=CAM_ASM_000251 /TAXON_ID=180227 /ORGANISM="Neoparamoeba aestuarina, Strain SoJaBio B1-5/56/2" /LENGTH=508 /DNA_ID=CAMNT_0047914515 /DNA_START=32 /DNA_END=1558 /DNA_ORIENTATION=+
MKVVVFSGEMGLASTDGEGSKASRLFSLCENRIPECLLPVCGQPILGHQLSLLAEVGLVDIIVVGHDWSVDLIRKFVSEKAKEGGKVSDLNVDVVTVPPHYCAADTLFLLKPKLDSDFLILNWDILFDPNLLHSLVDKHRIHSSILTCLFLQQETEKKEEKKGGKGAAPKKGGHQPAWSFDNLKNGVPFRSIPPRISHFFGVDGDRLLVAVPSEGAGGKGDEASSVRFTITKTMLRRFPDITVSRTLVDATVYLCGPQVLEFISANIDGMIKRTFQADVLPWVVKRQFTDPIFHVPDPLTQTEQLLRDMMDISGGNKDGKNKAVGNLGSPSGAKCFALIARGKSHGFISRVNSLQTLVEMNREVAHLSSSFFHPRGEKTPQNYFVGVGVEIGNKPQLGAESVIGDGSQVGDEGMIRRSIIGKNCKIGPKVKVVNSFVMDDVVLEGNTSISNTIVCSGAQLVSCTLNKAMVGYHVKLEKEKMEEEAHLDDSLMDGEGESGGPSSSDILI